MHCERRGNSDQNSEISTPIARMCTTIINHLRVQGAQRAMPPLSMGEKNERGRKRRVRKGKKGKTGKEKEKEEKEDGWKINELGSERNVVEMLSEKSKLEKSTERLSIGIGSGRGRAETTYHLRPL